MGSSLPVIGSKRMPPPATFEGAAGGVATAVGTAVGMAMGTVGGAAMTTGLTGADLSIIWGETAGTVGVTIWGDTIWGAAAVDVGIPCCAAGTTTEEIWESSCEAVGTVGLFGAFGGFDAFFVLTFGLLNLR